MKKLALVVFAVLLMMGLAVSSGAAEKGKTEGQHECMQMHKAGECGCGHGSPMAMFKKLGLDENQKAALRDIHLKTKKEIIKKRADIQLAKVDLKEILSKESVDLAAAEAAVKKVEGLKTDMKMIHIRAMEEVKSKLNPDQRKKFTAMVDHFMMRREMMRHGMMKHGMMGGCGCRMHDKHSMHEMGKKKPDQK